jgi:hypothetical protein
MRFWLGVGIAERFDSGEGRSVRVEGDSSSTFDGAVESLKTMKPPVVAGQVTAANAYVVRAETMQEAAELVVAVFERHETSPKVELVATSIATRQVEPSPPDVEALSRVHGELCITHQITSLALSHVTSGEYRDRLVRHQEASEDLGYGLRVMEAEMAGQERPELPPRGRERLGYGDYRLGDAESATLASALSSLAAELSIAQHQALVAQSVLPGGGTRLDDLVSELGRFAATVNESA